MLAPSSWANATKLADAVRGAEVSLIERYRDLGAELNRLAELYPSERQMLESDEAVALGLSRTSLRRAIKVDHAWSTLEPAVKAGKVTSIRNAMELLAPAKPEPEPDLSSVQAHVASELERAELEAAIVDAEVQQVAKETAHHEAQQRRIAEARSLCETDEEFRKWQVKAGLTDDEPEPEPDSVFTIKSIVESPDDFLWTVRQMEEMLEDLLHDKAAIIDLAKFGDAIEYCDVARYFKDMADSAYSLGEAINEAKKK